MCPSLNEDPSAYWQELSDCKSDIEANLNLGCRANLIKDFKAYEILPAEPQGFGVASLVIPI